MYIFGFLEDLENSSLIERYMLPLGYMEMSQQINEYNDYRDDHLTWVVHTETQVLETIDPHNQVLNDFRYFCNDKRQVE